MPRLELRIQGVKERRGKNPFTGEALVVPGRPASVQFFEAELRGSVVHYAEGGPEQSTRTRQMEFATEDEAYGVYAKAIIGKRKRGYVEVGPALTFDGAAPEPAGSSVLLEVYFAAGDPRFLQELLRTKGPKKLAALASRWYTDKRPFAREMLQGYIEDGCMRAEHQPLVKRLLKQAEAAKDHDLMARCMVAFDRSHRRSLQTTGYYWDSANRTHVRELGLRDDPLVQECLPKGKQATEFSRATRRYLARRAFRYFRRLGYRDSAAYRQVMVQALVSYREEHVNTVGKLLGAWGLVHVLYGRSPVLERRPRGVRLAAGATLANLSPAPLFPEIWAQSFDELLLLVTQGGCRTVRAFAAALLKQGFEVQLAQLPLETLKNLLLANDEEAQVLGVTLFQSRASLEALNTEDWRKLLGIENIEVLSVVCERAMTALDASSLSLAACVDWVLSPAAPLARLALGFCRQKPVESPEALQIVLRTCQAKVAAVRADAAAYCGELLARLPYASLEQIRDLCDSQYRDVRAVGLETARRLLSTDVGLWVALGESPYPDVRREVLERAGGFQNSPPQTLKHLFGTVLYSLQGAAKDKRRVACELVARLGAEPEQAPTLLPLLGALLQSIHPAERAVALGALTRIALTNDALCAVTQQVFPEFVLSGRVSQ